MKYELDRTDGQDNFFAQLILIINCFYNHKSKCGHFSDLG